ncbi:MAG TPA: extracellular solute-binding protein, partial [Ktedonobacteraceae bacterium]|nr:extracellular solute-binding protein [Ktedonobacteraceae bacterium]
HTDVSIWSQQAVVSSIAAGTAPTWYEGSILGSFIDNVVFSQFARGLAADVTSLVKSTNLENQLTPEYLPGYKYWKVNGKYYGVPGGFGEGDGIFYRRDLIKAADLVEPTPGWTWEDFRTLAKNLQAANPKMKGAALDFYIFDLGLSANGLNSNPTSYGGLGLEPTPNNSWPWRYNLTPWLSQYEALVNNWRGLYFADKTLNSSLTGGVNVGQMFATGSAAMCNGNSSAFQRPLSDPTNVTNIAIKQGKPFSDVIGFISYPIGNLGSFGATQKGGVVCSVEPHLQRNQPALAKAFDFAVQFLIGQSMVNMRQAIYHTTHDAKRVFLEIPPMSRLQITYGLKDVTAADAWGQPTVDAIKAMQNIPELPRPSLYFPAEQNAGPTGDPWNDANSGLAFTQDSIPAVLAKLQSTQNAQFASISSSVDKSTFIASARKYFADLDAFWLKYAPQFANEQFHPWYEQTVLPALGG